MISTGQAVTFLAVFAAVLAAYALGQRGRRRSAPRHAEPRRLPGNAPQVEVLLEYRNATGFTTMRKIRILAFAPRRGGRSCLFAVCNNGTQPRTFRIDRIVSIATLDGEVLDTRQFLTECLGVPV